MEAVKLIKPNLLQSKIFLVSLFVGKNLGSLNKKKFRPMAMMGKGGAPMMGFRRPIPDAGGPMMKQPATAGYGGFGAGMGKGMGKGFGSEADAGLSPAWGSGAPMALPPVGGKGGWFGGGAGLDAGFGAGMGGKGAGFGAGGPAAAWGGDAWGGGGAPGAWGGVPGWGSYDPWAAPDDRITCSTHGKMRSASSCVPSPDGTWACRPDNSCKVGPADGFPATEVEQETCVTHGRLRAVSYLTQGPDGKWHCKVGRECKTRAGF